MIKVNKWTGAEIESGKQGKIENEFEVLFFDFKAAARSP